MDAEEAGEAGDASPGYSSSICVAGWSQAHFQMCLDDDDALSSSFVVLFSWEACGILLQEGGFPCRDLLEGWGPGQGPS